MNTQLQNALNESPEAISRFLTPIFSDENFDATISKQQFNELLELSDLNDADLRVALLPFAAAFSYAPISKFFVGAIVRGLSGRLYFGANIEVSGVQLGQAVHAEQSAISHAWMKGEEGVTDITINYSPCGHCRQFMNELNTAKELLIQLPQKDQKSLQEYLPESFGPADLGVTSGLMTKVNHNCSSDDNDPLIAAALERLNISHAPYTKNLSGTALRLKNGRVYSGAYAENAAFNPSLPPLQVAMIQLLMDGASIDDIETAALVEMSAGSISHVADTQATLEAINPDITLSYLAI